MLNKNIRDLVAYGMKTGLVPACEKITLQIFCWIYSTRMSMKSLWKNRFVKNWN